MAQFDIIGLLLSLTNFLNYRLWMEDINGAYLQSRSIGRIFYVRPSTEWSGMKQHEGGKLWKLNKLPYIIVEAGRQWRQTVENWMLQDMQLERVKGISQVFVERNTQHKICIIIAGVTDDFLCSCSIETITQFIKKLPNRFTVGKVIINEALLFNGCQIKQDTTCNIRMKMNRYMQRTKSVPMDRGRNNQRSELATRDETLRYRCLAGPLMYIKGGVLLQAAYWTPNMQQRLPHLRVLHLIDGNNTVKEPLSLQSYLTYFEPIDVVNVVWSTFSDASHPHDNYYGLRGLVLGLRITQQNKPDLYHVRDWSSQKQRRVSCSAYGAEVLAAARGDDRGYYFKMCMDSLFAEKTLGQKFVVGSRGLCNTMGVIR